ncbi:protein phosphatase [Prauserella sp. PE36]|uniref:Serine/threonine-protein phosphatase n=1 Tax=Prauserella endophytica TaxID=1592324 RepID=A0ABY2S7K0_9PSEU|nr:MULTISPECIES: PP2C family serine/threonine-protein phosphatase [Prauserella]PXY21662.1 protein phosphatase [Prauserella coralliicola]RBM20035.1 protein phosphatase [Prauserella sp. PE36]TKG71441.1 serine/threonine-protein phosphatase [Prauserella endophytica]
MTRDEALGLSYAVGSDVGQRRSANEDSAYATPRLLAVADGMGGHAAGEVASALAIEAMADLDNRLAEAEHEPADLLEVLGEGVADASARLNERVADDPELEGMGTTLTAMLWDGDTFGLAHIGDSRGYLLRAGELSQLTRDHTMVQSLVDEGKMPPELAARHPGRSVLIRALMAGSPAEPDLSTHTAEPGDRYLLCSDGLTDVTTPEEIHEVLSSAATPEDAVGRLIDIANEGGGPDNITCVVAYVDC